MSKSMQRVTAEMNKSLQDTADKLAFIRASRIDRYKRLFVEAAQPDCRTCSNAQTWDGSLTCETRHDCTNGSEYQPAPAVVLWRTT